MEIARSTSTPASVASIAKNFRRASLAVRIPLRDRLRYWLAYVALAHRGKPTFSKELDSVYEDGFFARRYRRALERINARLAARPKQEEPLKVPTFDYDKLESKDLKVLTELRIPYVLRGAAKGLPVMDWTLDSLEEGWGECKGPINEALDEPSPNLDLPTKAHHDYDFRNLREAEEILERRGFAGYLRIPKVRAELRAGDLLRVPSFWWHTVETSPNTHTIASSMRVETGPSLVAPALLLMRLLDKQTHAIIKAFQTDGRISDKLIGQPRKSRTQT